LRRIVSIFILFLFLALFFAGGYYLGKKSQTVPLIKKKTKVDKSLSLVEEVIKTIEENYVGKVDEKKLVEGAAKGAVEALGDPYSHYYDRTHYRIFKENTSGYFYGVGIQITVKDGYPVVVAPLQNTPAQRAGIKGGDVIVKVDGKSVKGVPLDSVVGMIRGEKGTKVTLTIKRKGEKDLLDFELIREKIELANVSSKVLEDEIGYIYIHTFGERTSRDTRKEIEELLKKGVKGLIVDLRNNPGGLLNEAVLTTSLFIEDGVIVSVRSRDGKKEVYRAVHGIHGIGKAYDLPLVVLVNEGSASASEIFAGAIRDHGRGIIVGEKTFGKGSVQNMIPLSNGAGLILTTAKYFTPNGESIHEKGITPDVIVKGSNNLGEKDPQLERAIEVLKKELRKAA
jgi:carboxyl-terminal processing protease